MISTKLYYESIKYFLSGESVKLTEARAMMMILEVR